MHTTAPRDRATVAFHTYIYRVCALFALIAGGSFLTPDIMYYAHVEITGISKVNRNYIYFTPCFFCPTRPKKRAFGAQAYRKLTANRSADPPIPGRRATDIVKATQQHGGYVTERLCYLRLNAGFNCHAAAADFFGYSTRQWARFEAGHPLPKAVQMMLELRAGELGMLNAKWHGWLFCPKTGNLVSPCNQQFSPGQVLAITYLQQFVQAARADRRGNQSPAVEPAARTPYQQRGRG